MSLITNDCAEGRHGLTCPRNPLGPMGAQGRAVCECACHMLHTLRLRTQLLSVVSAAIHDPTDPLGETRYEMELTMTNRAAPGETEVWVHRGTDKPYRLVTLPTPEAARHYVVQWIIRRHGGALTEEEEQP